MKAKILSSLILVFNLAPFCFADGPVKFEFKYKKGDSYRIISTVEEDVYINRQKSHHATILNRVSAKVTDVKKDGSGVHEATFMTSEDSVSSRTNRIFQYGEEYKSIFTRSKSGVYTISDEYFMPVVRDVPVFPDREISVGEKWTHEGHEAHDMRAGFGIDRPFKVPFVAEYEYLGVEESSGLHKIKAKYVMNMESPDPADASYFSEVPKTTQGFSDEIIYWDNEKGTIDHYTEEFRILITTSRGNLFEFTGKAHAEVTEFKTANTKENLKAVSKQVKDLGLENVTVKQGEKGLVISIENIQFEADSSVLVESERIKLNHIAEILKKWPDNDILVSGHTALAGTEKMRQLLSEERAAAVADYLIDLEVKDQYHIFTQGFGATQPVAPNNNERNKAKNRRVEITILD